MERMVKTDGTRRSATQLVTRVHNTVGPRVGSSGGCGAGLNPAGDRLVLPRAGRGPGPRGVRQARRSRTVMFGKRLRVCKAVMWV